MTNAEYFLMGGNDSIDYFIDKWIDSGQNLSDFLRTEYTERWNCDD